MSAHPTNNSQPSPEKSAHLCLIPKCLSLLRSYRRSPLRIAEVREVERSNERSGRTGEGRTPAKAALQQRLSDAADASEQRPSRPSDTQRAATEPPLPLPDRRPRRRGPPLPLPDRGPPLPLPDCPTSPPHCNFLDPPLPLRLCGCAPHSLRVTPCAAGTSGLRHCLLAESLDFHFQGDMGGSKHMFSFLFTVNNGAPAICLNQIVFSIFFT